MDDWIIHEIIKGNKRYRIDANSLANLSSETIISRLQAGRGISIIVSPDGLQCISVDPDVSDKLDALDALVDHVFPVTITEISKTGFGTFELGDVVTPSISWKVTRNIGDEITETSIIPQIYIGSDWTSLVSSPLSNATEYQFPSVTTDTSARILASGPSFQGELILGPFITKFTRYRYYGILNERPGDITEELVKSLGTSELNTSSTLGNTQIGANQYFLFVVPGVKSLVVRHTGTDGIVDSRGGTVHIRRKNGTDSGYTYSWVLVPASSITWSFKITNT